MEEVLAVSMEEVGGMAVGVTVGGDTVGAGVALDLGLPPAR
jgi:hypothetical protein